VQDHTGLFVTSSDLAEARERAGSRAWARALYERLGAQASEAATAPLPQFDGEWYRPLAASPWGDIYPEVAEHTYFRPNAAAMPALRLALAGALGLGDAYARRAAEIVLAFARTYDFSPVHWDVGMNYAGFGMLLLYAYDLASDAMDQGERGEARSFFDRLCAAVEQNDRTWTERLPWNAYNNHYAWHKWAIGSVGLLLGQPERVDYALNGPMGVRELLEGGVMDDGLWFESSTAYHFTTLYALMPLAEALRNAQWPVDLYTAEFRGGRCLRQLLDAPLGMAFPDATLPTIGDCYGRAVCLRSEYAYEYGYRAYGDPAYGWLIADGPRTYGGIHEYCALTHGHDVPEGVRPPRAPSRIFREHGWAMLRSEEGPAYYGSDALAACLTFDRSSVHANADGLSLTLFGRGRCLLTDAEATASGHAFSSDVQRELNRSSVCQNLLLVDESDQRPRSQTLRLAEACLDGPIRRITVDDEGALYEGVRQRRTIIVTADYVVDILTAGSSSPHVYDFLLHSVDDDGLTRTDLDLETTTALAPWAKWIRNARRARCGRQVSLRWCQGDVWLSIQLVTDGPAELVVADFPRTHSLELPPLPMALVRRRAPGVVFAALYQASRGEPAGGSIDIVQADAASGRVSVVVEGPWGQVEHEVGR